MPTIVSQKYVLKNNPKTRIMIFGTFDIIHPGHEHFFKQARNLARQSFLIVSLARDVNVKKIKGARPRNNERIRKAAVAAHPLVDQALLGGLNNYLTHIIKANPNIIALGYDQKAYTQTLLRDLKQAGLKTKVVRLKSHKPAIYKTSKLIDKKPHAR